jgi:hypothetical protein
MRYGREVMEKLTTALRLLNEADSMACADAYPIARRLESLRKHTMDVIHAVNVENNKGETGEG